MKYEVAAVIGRFQPFHNGHFALIKHAFTLAPRVVILVGSTEQPRSLRNPFTFEERESMIRKALADVCVPGSPYPLSYSILSVPDTPYELTTWQERVQLAVRSVAPTAKNVAIVGCNKDSSTFYLSLFPQWTHADPTGEPGISLEVHATGIRQLYFSDTTSNDWKHFVPETTDQMLLEFQGTEHFRNLRAESKFIEQYKKDHRYAGVNYPTSAQTVDAVVIQGGHILLIKRRSFPGKGLGALPGGYVEEGERLVDAVIRELKEETLIDVPENILRSSIVASYTFDDPFRDPRGRVYSQGFLIDLDHELQNRIKRWGKSKAGLSKVLGSDDAAKASWIPIAELDGSRLWADHIHVINKMLSFKK